MGGVRVTTKIHLDRVESTITGQMRRNVIRGGKERVGKEGFSKRNIINHFVPVAWSTHVNSFCMHAYSMLLKTLVQSSEAKEKTRSGRAQTMAMPLIL